MFNLQNHVLLKAFLRLVEEDDIATGVQLYFLLVFCDEESFQLFEFFRTLIHDKTIRTLILSTIKNMASKDIKNCQNKQNLKLFYRKLTNSLDLQLEEVLEAISSSSGLEALIASDLPFVFNKTMKNSDFNILGKYLISSYSSKRTI